MRRQYRGDGLAEDVTNCSHEVVADNRILSTT